MRTLTFGQSRQLAVEGVLKASPEDFEVREVHGDLAEDCHDYSLKRVELVNYSDDSFVEIIEIFRTSWMRLLNLENPI